jgi:hypothetical protein
MWQYFWPHTVQGFATSDCRFMLRFQVDGLKIVQFVGDVYVPFKKTDGVVGFRAVGAYMFTPFEVR